MINLKEKLKEEFPNTKIIKLKNITKKISVVSKVRIGKLRDCTNYDEVSLNYLDEYGVVQVQKSNKEMGPAAQTAIDRQNLAKGDLLMLHRGKVGKIGLVDKSYSRPTIGNNSMIRIQFEKNFDSKLPKFVQAYLQLPYVKQYIDDQISASKDRKMITSAWISELPIPLFKDTIFGFDEFINTRVALLNEAKKMQNAANKLVEHIENSINECVKLQINEAEGVKFINTKDREMLKLITTINNNIYSIH